MKPTPECRLFGDLASSVWGRMRAGHALGIPQGEVGITEYLLLELAIANLASVRVGVVSTAHEAVIGCDWEWYVGNPNDGWLRFAVQAKRLDPKSHRYKSLNHTVGKGRSRQVDLLRRYAKLVGAVPLYCLYNSPASCSKTDHWHCTRTFDPSQLGCSIATIDTIDWALRTQGCRNFASIHNKPSTVPWRCLVCCDHVSAVGAVSQCGISAITKSAKRFPTTPLDEQGALDGVYVLEDLGPNYPESLEYLPHNVARIMIDLPRD